MSPPPPTSVTLQQQPSNGLEANQDKMSEEDESGIKNQSNNHHHNVAVSSPSSASVGQLVCCSFNQDGGCLAIGTTTGFSVIQVHPYSLSVQRDLRGSIGGIEMLFRCNIMALVGGGESTPTSNTQTISPTSSPNTSSSTSIPYAPAHRVLIWDDHVPKEIGELSFRQVVLRVKLRRDAIAVALRDRIYVYHLHDLSLRDKIYTADNPHGLLSLSTTVHSTANVSNTSNNTSSANNSSSHDMVLACPSITTGHVRVELYGFRKTVLMEAHQHALQALALTSDGTLLATASVQGTLLRVWNVQQGTCVQEFRRGLERANISCLAWSANSSSTAGIVESEEYGGHHSDRFGQHHQRSYNQHGASSSSSTCPMGWLACSSDKGTTHVFQLGSTSQSVNSATSSITKRLWNTILTTATSNSNNMSNGGGEIKSVAQVRGVPHPLACAFCPSPTAAIPPFTTTTPFNNTVSPGHTCPLLAVAGYDADGNGVLLVSDITSCLVGSTTRATSSTLEPRRVSYHVLCKATNTTTSGGNPDDDEEGGDYDNSKEHDDDDPQDDELRRRRRLLHTKPQQALQNQQQKHQKHGANTSKSSDAAAFLIQDRTNATMNQFQFDEIDDSEFVAVIASKITAEGDDDGVASPKSSSSPSVDQQPPQKDDGDVNQELPDSGVVPVGSDSVRTEPLEDDDRAANGGDQQTEPN